MFMSLLVTCIWLRCLCAAVKPSLFTRLYVSGGIWLTINGGAQWAETEVYICQWKSESRKLQPGSSCCSPCSHNSLWLNIIGKRALGWENTAVPARKHTNTQRQQSISSELYIFPKCAAEMQRQQPDPCSEHTDTLRLEQRCTISNNAWKRREKEQDSERKGS